MKVTGPNPFSDYDEIVKEGFDSLNNQLNAKYREVAETKYTTTEQESFFLNKFDSFDKNIATVCDKDATCDRNI